jgi:hypothetical protein
MLSKTVFGVLIRMSIILEILLVLFKGELRAQYSSKYEPPDGRVIHGLGQHTPFYYSEEENWQLVNEYQDAINHIPMVYSAYAILDPYANSLDSTDFIDIITNHGRPYLLMIGLTLLDSSYLNGYQINIPVNKILNGTLDYRIIDIAQRIKAINAPVYLRPGFEFGNGNDGMHSDPDMTPTNFVNIWIHIYNIFSQQNVTNVAWVWNTVNPHFFNYLEWYPGNEYVDWWGINLYTLNQIDYSNSFLNDASLHNKPVFICESCPIHNNGTLNPDNWANWFIPYFNKIRSNSSIKGIIYISDSWDRGPFAMWADSRINNNELIRHNYEIEMNESMYIHGDEYLSNPFIIGDNIPPDSVSNFTAVGENQSISLSWNNPSDPDLAGVKILRKNQNYPLNPNDGLLVYDGLDINYYDMQLQNNITYYYAAFAYDTIPNYSEAALTSATPFDPIGIKNEEECPSNENITLKNAPNPFNMGTIVSWYISINAYVNLSIYNILGQKVFSTGRKWERKGLKQIYWSTIDLPSGVYLGFLSVENRNLMIHEFLIHKMLIIK